MTQGNQPNPYLQNPYQPTTGWQDQPQHEQGRSPHGQSQPPWGQPQSGQSESPYGQSPYDQSPYGQSGYSQSPYGQHGYEQSSYGQPGPAQPAYAPAQTYGQIQPAYGRATARPLSPLLGMIALGLVAVATVVFCWAMWRAGVVMGPVIASSGGALSEDEITGMLLSELSGVSMLIGNVSFYAGVAGWVTGIVATATRRGRTYGVWAIILGILAPVLGVILGFAAMLPYLT